MAFNGRQLTLDWDATTLVGVQSKSANLNNELVDVTTDDSNGWTTFLPTPGKKGVTYDVSGVTSDEVLIGAYFANQIEGTVINLPSELATPGDITGTGVISNVTLEATHDGAYNFSANIASSGAVTYTASTA